LLRKITVLLMALVMTVAMSVPAFAASTTYDVWPSDSAAFQLQNSASAYASTGAVTVYLDLHSKKVNGSALDKHYTVVLGTPSTGSRTVTVTQVLAKAMADHSELKFQNSSGANINANATSFYQVVYNGTVYSPSGIGEKDGWMVRINKKLVLLSGSPNTSSAYGAAINNTYVKNGSTIDVYMDKVSSENDASNFPRIQNAVYDPSTKKLTSVTVEASKDWFGGTNYSIWYINPFTPLSNATVKIYDSTGDDVASAQTIADGTATLNHTLSAGNYRIQVEPTFKTNGYYANIHSQIHCTVDANGGITWKRY